MSDLRVRLLISAENTSGPPLNQARNDVRGIDDQMALLNTRFNQFLALKVGEVIAGWGASLVQTADNYQVLAAKLDRVTDSYQEQIAVQKELFDIAQDARVKLTLAEDTYNKNADAIKRMGGNTEHALQVTETLAKAIASTSQGVSQDTAALNQWSQALGKGVLNGDELNSIMENSLGLTQAIADGMGIPIGKLKELGEQGKLTGTDLVNALINQKTHIDEIFHSVPITAEQGVTTMVNAWTKYIGEANKAYGVTQNLAEGLVEVSKHIPEIVEGTLLLAGIYGVKLTASLALFIDSTLSATAASRAATAAAEHEAIVNLELLRVQTEVTAMRVNAMRAMLEEARLERALAVSAQDAAVAQERLALAARNVAIAEEEAALATRLYQNELNPAVAEMTAAQLAATGLNAAFNLLIAGWIGWEVGTFLRKFEAIRDAGSYVAEAFALMIAQTEHLLSGNFLNGNALVEKQLAIHREFKALRQQDSDESRAAAEQKKRQHEQEIKLLEVEKIARETAFKELQSQLKETSAQIDQEYARQNASIKQALEQRKTEIMASAIPELQKEMAISKAIEESNAARLLTIQQAADKKLLLLDQVYGAELVKLKAGTVEQKAVEKQSIEERIAVYSQLEKNYSSIIDGLIADEQRHAQAAANLLDQRENLEQGTQEAIRRIKQAGMSDDELLADQKKQLDENLSAQRQALAAGDVENAKKYGEAAAKMAEQLATQAEAAYKAGKGYSSDADKFIKKLEEARKGIGEALGKETEAHKTQQAKLADSIADVKGKLTETQSKITELGEQLREKFLLQIDADTRAVDAAIARIQQPTQSTHTIHVVEDSGGRVVVRDGDSFTDAPAKFSPTSSGTSNPVAPTISELPDFSPTLLLPDIAPKAIPVINNAAGEPIQEIVTAPKREIRKVGDSYFDVPQGFQDGGFPRVQGQLPGYGGGDRVRALLEDGEFVLRKEAVAANGPDTIQALNNGKIRIAPVQRFNFGGLVVPGMEQFADEMQQMQNERDRQRIEQVVRNFGFYGIGTSGRVDPILMGRNIEKALKDVKNRDAVDKALQAVQLYWKWAPAPNRADNKIYKDQAEALMNHLFDEDPKKEPRQRQERPNMDAIRLPERPALTPNIPIISSQAASQLIHGSRGGGSKDKVVTVEFKSPAGGATVTGQFKETDVDALLRTLQDAAAAGAQPGRSY